MLNIENNFENLEKFLRFYNNIIKLMDNIIDKTSIQHDLSLKEIKNELEINLKLTEKIEETLSAKLVLRTQSVPISQLLFSKILKVKPLVKSRSFEEKFEIFLMKYPELRNIDTCLLQKCKEFWPMGAMCRLCVHFEFFDWIL